MSFAAACACCGSSPEGCACYRHPAQGAVLPIDDLGVLPEDQPKAEARLGTWSATAICGNDITSSCLYVSALAALYAGPLAPVALLLVAGVLYLFRGIYAEAVTALPLNGGAYNVLLNTTTKRKAAVAACLTLLSYLATAVISASEAVHYAALLVPSLPVMGVTVGLLAVFAALNILGLSESARVAVGIFVLHIVTLTGLALLGGAALLQDPSLLWDTLRLPPDQWPRPPAGGLIGGLFLGFAAGMLGISGFESSANFVEEQKPGVFPKTLRNMWIAVAVFNPLLSLLSLGLLTLPEVAGNKEALLAEMGHHAVLALGGSEGAARAVEVWIGLDAAIVLSGAVLTSFVGVTGLVRRMGLDLVLPQVLLRTNRWRGTPHVILLGFFALCAGVLLATGGHIEVLAGVYTLSFLSVMGLFAWGDRLLQRRHPELPRVGRAPRWTLALGGAAVVAALIGNVALDPRSVRVFVLFLLASLAVVGVMFTRVPLSQAGLGLLADLLPVEGRVTARIRGFVQARIHSIHCRTIAFVPAGASRAEIEAGVAYILRNEDIRRVRVVWFHDGAGVPEEVETAVSRLDAAWPTLRLDLVPVRAAFGPETLRAVARRLRVPLNFVLVGSGGGRRVQDVAALGGVRLVV